MGARAHWGVAVLGVAVIAAAAAPSRPRTTPGGDEAADLAQRCDAGRGVDCRRLGHRYQDGLGVPADKARAATLYQRACTLSDAQGCLMAMQGLPNGDARAQSLLDQTVRILQEGCGREQPPECGRLGFFHIFGRGVALDRAKGVALLEKSCRLRDAASCDALAELYDEALIPGTTDRLQDAERASSLRAQASRLRGEACQAGDREACEEQRSTGRPQILSTD
jgi:TPR repeat protein